MYHEYMRRRILLFCALLPVAPLLVAQTSPQAATKAPSIDTGAITNGIYKNELFAFSYRIPVSWVDRTDEMQEASTDPKKSTVLLGVFERPPQASGPTVNSAVVIAAETASSYPGLKNAAQYFGPISQVSESKGLKPVNEPYEFPVDGKAIVRRDFVKQSGPGMHQTTLALLSRGYVLSFTFIGSSDDEVQQLIEALKFGVSRHSSAGSGKTPKPTS